MKENFKIVVRVLSISVIVLLLLSFFIKDEIAKKILLYTGLAIAVAIFLQIVLFLIRPKWFRNKPTREGIETKVFDK